MKRLSHSRQISGQILPYLLVWMWVAFFCLPEGIHAQPQNHRFAHISLEEGLSQATIYCLLQDQEGFVWIGTEDGLHRYDGYEFDYFKYEPNNPNSLSNNDVRAVLEDRQGQIWVGTHGGGVNVIAKRSKKIRRFETLAEGRITCLLEDRLGHLWAGTERNGLYRWNPQSDQWTSLQGDRLPPTSITALHEDPEGHIWIGSREKGLYRYTPQDQSIAHFPLLSGSSGEPGSYVTGMLTAGDQLWVGTSMGLYLIDPATGSSQRFQAVSGPGYAPENHLSALLEGSNGELWLGTLNHGIYLFDPGKKSFSHIPARPGLPWALNQGRILSLMKDRTGLLWIGTFGGGINIFDKASTSFTHYRSVPNDPNSLSHPEVRSLFLARNNELWVATTGGGLNRFDRSRQKVKVYRHDARRPESLSSDEVYYVFQDSKSRIWVGTREGLDLMLEESGVFRHFTPQKEQPGALSHQKVRFIYEDRHQRLWIGTEGGGVNLLEDPSSGRFMVFSHHPEDPNSLSSNDVRAITEDHKGQIWVATYGGLNKLVYDSLTQTAHITRYYHRVEDPHSLSMDWVQCLYEDPSGILWIGTNVGLNRFDPQSGRFTHFTEKDGLPNNLIYGILPDDRGKLWLSTNRGVAAFDPLFQERDNKSPFQVFDIHNGLQSFEFNGQAYHKGHNGELFFGGINGFNAFFPDSIQADPHPPQLVVTGFFLDTDSGSIDRTSRLEREGGILELDNTQNSFTLEFAALHYSFPEKNQYAYMMEGLEKGWKYIGSRRYASYSHLPPGHYTFRLKAANPDGVWTEEALALQFTIQPPFWLSGWAFAGYALLLGLLAWVAIHAERQKLKRERYALAKERELNEKLTQADKLKDDFLANTSHELRTPLNGIIGIAESLLDGVAGPINDTLQQNLSMIIFSAKRLANLVNDILDFSRLKTRNLELNAKPIDLKALLDIALKIHQPLAQGKHLELTSDMAEDLPTVMADENRLMQIIHNLVGNAIKFTQEGSVKVSAKPLGQFVEVAIEDTGIGIPAKAQRIIFHSFEQGDGSLSRSFGGTGLGLTITKQLVELHGGSIWFTSKVGKGSVFHFTLPISGEQPQSLSSIRQRQLYKELQLTPAGKNGATKSDVHILLVDDDIINLQVLQNHLSGESYDITSALNGEEALRLLENGKHFDLVLLDVMMPKVSGLEVVRRIRERYLPSELPVIMITARNQISDLVEGFSYGANDYLTKPFSKQEFLARIKTHLHLHHINAAYGRFVPHAFLRSLGHDSILDVHLGDQVQKEVTVLFSDIRDYTALSERMTPEENFNFLNGYLGRVSPIIQSRGGIVNQFFGDGIMALFLERPENAVLAAIEIQRRLESYNEEREAKGRKPIRTGIGLHTGPLMLGILGDEERMEAGVVSDTVNTASRMEGLTKVFGANIIASESTIARIKEEEFASSRFLAKVRVKGKKDVVSVYEIFEGDAAEVREQKRQTLDDYQAALKCYFKRDFATSSERFKKVLTLNPRDRTAKRYLLNCTKYMIQGVSPKWDGVEEMESK